MAGEVGTFVTLTAGFGTVVEGWMHPQRLTARMRMHAKSNRLIGVKWGGRGIKVVE